MWAFYFFATIVIWLGLLSLRGGFRYSAYFHSQLSLPLPDFTPFASVIVPCRGLEENLEKNLAALLRQDYPAYEVLFVTDSASDGCFHAISNLIAQHPHALTRLVIAGPATDSGQKVHNLRVAVAEVAAAGEVIVFVDSDVQAESNWLRSLVTPLQDRELGAATGYRWFVPSSGGFASQLRSVWNASIVSALGADRRGNFCWGGSTAIRRETFARLKIRERWRGTVSDDFTITRILREQKLPIQFVPACLVGSVGDCSLRELLEFSNRQLKITRVYAAHLWKPVLVGSLLFCVVFFGGLVLVGARALAGQSFLLPLVLLAVIFLLGTAKAWIRFQAVSEVVSMSAAQRSRDLIYHLLFWPVASALYLYNALAAAFSRRITWRGITYELKSETEMRVVSGQ